MKIEDWVEEGFACSFTLVGASDAEANAIRRALIDCVPVAAIKNVRFVENSSQFEDEQIAHVIGLIPIRAGGAVGHEVGRLFLSVAGPADVYSSQLKGDGVVVANPDVLIAHLLDGQHLQLDAAVVIGTGATHARWSAAVAPCYRHKTVGVTHKKECFCPGTLWGQICAQCGDRKRDEIFASSPICHAFRFETTGALTCAELLSSAVGGICLLLEAVKDQISIYE